MKNPQIIYDLVDETVIIGAVKAAAQAAQASARIADFFDHAEDNDRRLRYLTDPANHRHARVIQKEDGSFRFEDDEDEIHYILKMTGKPMKGERS